MKVNNKNIQKLLEHYREISLLEKVKATLDWDLNVNMPAQGVEGRAEQTTLLTKIITEKWIDDRFKKLIEEVDTVSLNEEEKAVIRNIRRLGEFYFKVPKDLILEKSTVTTQAFIVWSEAKKNNDFKSFEPYLNKIIDIERSVADYLGYKKNKYDALLNLYEPGLTVEFLDSVFIPLQEELSAYILKIKDSKLYKNSEFFEKKHYPQKMQQKLAEYVMHLMYYAYDEGRLDVSAHPFTTTLDRYDVRVTTKYLLEDFRSSYSATVHEVGHALYELGVNTEYSYTPLEGGVSLGIHESQSRFWENQVGRNHLFLEFMAPAFQSMYSDYSLTPQRLTQSLNNVNPDLIRIEADEVTYNLHIILRFEIERDLINNVIQVKDVPEIWNYKMKQYLGVFPKNDSEGCLQDVHWSYGSFGYFPTYSLGNLYAAQFTNSMKKEVDVDTCLKTGELKSVLDWLRKNIHIFGSLYLPEELVQKVSGESLNPQYFVDYIKEKYNDIYKLS